MTLLNKYSLENIWAFIWTVNWTCEKKTISLLRKLQNNLPTAPLVTIYKSFMRPYLHYGDILYE